MVSENTKNFVVHERRKVIYNLSNISPKLFRRNLLLYGFKEHENLIIK